jgi:hypothetical protein
LYWLRSRRTRCISTRVKRFLSAVGTFSWINWKHALVQYSNTSIRIISLLEQGEIQLLFHSEINILC